jgi:hypothetical protein
MQSQKKPVPKAVPKKKYGEPYPPMGFYKGLKINLLAQFPYDLLWIAKDLCFFKAGHKEKVCTFAADIERE